MVVLDPLIEPNWSLSIWSRIDCKSQLYGNDSRIFLTMGVSDIGRKSESTSRAGEDFAAGMTFADFHRDGTQPS
jgi:hypothetical protein